MKSCKSHEKDENKNIRLLFFSFFINRSNILMLFVLFFHVVCKISNFNMWTTKHLVQVSCTELTLKIVFIKGDQINLRNDNEYLVVLMYMRPKGSEKILLISLNWHSIFVTNKSQLFTYRLFLMRAFEKKFAQYCLYTSSKFSRP